MNDTIKYGVIGTGAMGQEHIQNINIIENKFIKTSFLANLLKYTAVGDTARKRLTSMHDINFMCLMKKYGIKTKILPQIA